MDNYLRNINDALKFATIRMKWYEQSGEYRHLEEAMDWISVANIYGKEIKNEAGKSADRISY